MRVFIAGVMQGSRSDERVTDQSYRCVVTRILQANIEPVEIIDPWALHPESEGYDAERALKTFKGMNALAAEVDVLVAYLPEASMGTAIEVWEAYRSGAKVFTISPMSHNWVIKLLSTRVFGTLEEFESFVQEGGVASTPS